MKKTGLYIIIACVLVAVLLIGILAKCAADDPSDISSESSSDSSSGDHTHTYGEWITVKQSTCTERGYMKRSCSCGNTETKMTDLAEHSESDWIIDKQATETEEGKRHTECTRCHIKLKEETTAKLKKPSEGLKYRVNSDGVTCTITGIGTCTDTDLVIPSVIDGYTVTIIGTYAFDYCNLLISVTIGNDVTSIDGFAFSECTSLTEINYNGTIAQWQKISISGSAFYSVKTSVVHCKDGDVEIKTW